MLLIIALILAFFIIRLALIYRDKNSYSREVPNTITEQKFTKSITNEQLKIFQSAFEKANYGKISMPNKIDSNKIYDIEFYPNGMREGYRVRFRIFKDIYQNYFIDLFGSDDYSSWHKRIEKDGSIIDLENFKGQFGRTVYPDDPEKTKKEHKEIQYFNDNLNKELILKGLRRDFENEEFEETNVIKLRNYG